MPDGQCDRPLTVDDARGAAYDSRQPEIARRLGARRDERSVTMSEFSRRTLLGSAVAVAATNLWTEPVHAQYVWQKADWQAAEFEALTRSSRRIKLVVHGFGINDARVLKNAKNALNGLHFGSNVANDQVQVVCALNGPANMMNYTDYVWEKYRVGAWIKENDPKTGEPAVRNLFYPAKGGAAMHYASDDPSSEESLYQDYSVQALTSRGVRFLSCHSSTEEAARALIKMNNLSAQPEDVVKDIHAHALPGVIIVPALSAALAQLQSDGRYGYMSAG
jgi:intracellular sulfur oxidation DsrE/DsrF family protein